MKTVALVSSEQFRDVDPDLPFLLAAMAVHGLQVDVRSWRDPDVSWSRFDAVVMRSPWDYSEDVDAFRTWLKMVKGRAKFFNCPDTIEWNLDKSYLIDLASAGVPVVPTRLCRSIAEVQAAIVGTDAPELVIKPTVSAGARDTGWFQRGDPAAVRLANHILVMDKAVLVQPFVASVATRGETALVYFGGRFSHAVAKGPLLEAGGGLAGGTYTEVVAETDPTPAQRQVAESVLHASTAGIRARGCNCRVATPLYARIDLVSGDDDCPLLLEAELFEPTYFLNLAPQGADRFAQSLVERIG